MSMATEDLGSSKRFEEGLAVIKEAVDRTISIAEGHDTQKFTSEDYMRYYADRLIYELSCPNVKEDYSLQLYDYYKKTFEEYTTSKALPSFSGKRDQELLQELVNRWSIHKIMTYWLSRFFNFLGRYFIEKRKLPSLQETSFIAFYNLVYCDIFGQVRDAVTLMINREREGEQIDQALVKHVLTINSEIRVGSLEHYEQDLEEAILEDTAAFYAQKASDWIQDKSYNEYMLMVNQCLTHEKSAVLSFLQDKNQRKLVEVIEHELLNIHASELEGKKQNEAPDRYHL